MIAEVILAQIDSRLKKKFAYARYMDDYTAYCESHEKSEQFILALSEELAQYKLLLNIGKTSIHPLPKAATPNWIIDLSNALYQREAWSVNSITNYLDFAVSLANHSPDGSVLKYALKSLFRTILADDAIEGTAVRAALRYALNLSFYHPILVPLLEPLFDHMFSLEGEFQYSDDLQALMHEHIRLKHSDAISWTLYFSDKYDVPIRNCCSSEIIKTEDCIPMLLLYFTTDQVRKRRIVTFARKLAQKPDDLYRLDQYWLLLYQLFLENKIANPYGADASFDIMKAEGVSFVAPTPVLPVP